jgi:hypothetical protein
LGKIGPAAEKAVPELVQALIHDDFNIRRAAAETLGKIGAASDEALSALVETVNDDEYSEVRRKAADALRKIGPEGKYHPQRVIVHFTKEATTQERKEARRYFKAQLKDDFSEINTEVWNVNNTNQVLELYAQPAAVNGVEYIIPDDINSPFCVYKA